MNQHWHNVFGRIVASHTKLVWEGYAQSKDEAIHKAEESNIHFADFHGVYAREVVWSKRPPIQTAYAVGDEAEK